MIYLRNVFSKDIKVSLLYMLVQKVMSKQLIYVCLDMRSKNYKIPGARTRDDDIEIALRPSRREKK